MYTTPSENQAKKSHELYSHACRSCFKIKLSWLVAETVILLIFICEKPGRRRFWKMRSASSRLKVRVGASLVFFISDSSLGLQMRRGSEGKSNCLMCWFHRVCIVEARRFCEKYDETLECGLNSNYALVSFVLNWRKYDETLSLRVLYEFTSWFVNEIPHLDYVYIIYCAVEVVIQHVKGHHERWIASILDCPGQTHALFGFDNPST
jgi:hypothetical protein